MQRLIDNRGLAFRANISLAILSAVLIYGVWELLYAFSSDDATAYLFGALFVAGSAYGLRSTFLETRDMVVAFDADLETGAAMLTFWRPYKVKKVSTNLDRISGWRLWVQTASRNRRAYFLLAREESYPNTLQFALSPASPIPDGLRRIAPEPMQDFERETGLGLKPANDR